MDSCLHQVNLGPKSESRVRHAKEKGFSAQIGHGPDSVPLARVEDRGFPGQHSRPLRRHHQQLNPWVSPLRAHVLACVHLHEVHVALDQVRHGLSLALVQP